MITYTILYSLIAFFILFFASKISYKFNLVDIPNQRKKHSKPVAYTGGLTISIIYIISISLFNIGNEKLDYILILSFLIAIIGFIDDKHQLNFIQKLSLQFIIILYLTTVKKFYLNDLGEYNHFKLQLSFLAIPFTLLCVLLLINAFNYFDGLDGTLSFATITVLLILYFLTVDKNIKIFLISILIPLLIFLFFNFSILKLPKLFLGDSGSLMLGFIMAYTLIFYKNNTNIHPILLAWSVAIFVYEFLSIHLIRLKTKRYIFEPGQDHLHHILFMKFKKLYLTNFLISILNIIFFIIGYSSFKLLNSTVSLVLFIFFFIIYFFLRLNFSNYKSFN
jgi:UDP-GlcNAc:undecaprenyl-phosphate GlcNAc-1-phosphate transferase